MATVTVACKLPHGLVAMVDDKSVSFKGLNTSLIEGGFGVTEGVDKDFFDKWLSKNKELDFVKNGFVWSIQGEANLKAKAKEMKDEKTGLEPIDPKAQKAVEEVK